MADEAVGEVPVAFVVKSDGSDITQEEIIAYNTKQVAAACTVLDYKHLYG